MYFYLIAIAFCVAMIFVTTKNQKKSKLKNKLTRETQFKEEGFTVSKEQFAGGHPLLPYTLYVDDISKKFSFSRDDKLTFFSFSDLLGFELNEDGETITKGKGLATVAGAVTFGVVGALVGASGKKKNSSICTSMIVRLQINNLNEPQIVLPFISSNTKKSNFIYRTALENAKDLVATFTYIESKNNLTVNQE
ncbi:MAG: hypothetical protein ACLKAK_07100 [Alkaliphilus sp.]